MKIISEYFRKFVDWIKGYIKYLFTGLRLKQIVTTTILVICSWIFLVYLFDNWNDIAKIGIMSVVISIGIGFLVLVDLIMLKDIDTHEAIKEKNMAYIGYLLCVSIIVGASIIAFFSV